LLELKHTLRTARRIWPGLNKRMPSSYSLSSTARNFSHQLESGLSASFLVGEGGNCNRGCKHNRDTMLSNKPTDFTLIARLVNGQPADGKALAQSLFSQIGNRSSATQQ